MKKLSGLLVAVMMFVMVATAMGNATTVNAMAESDIDYSQFEWFDSGKAGASVYFRYDFPYETGKTLDVTGWKGALCPADNMTLEGAVFTFNVSADDKYVNDEYQYAVVSRSVKLDKDIPEGEYLQLFFDATGALVEASYYGAGNYVHKELTSASCWLMNDDGYAYAYVYSENPAVNASTYPTFYAADQTTAVTSFADYTVGRSKYGETVHYYKLNILDATEFAFDENGVSYVYYTMGNSAVGTYRANAKGIDWTTAVDLNLKAQKFPQQFAVEDPFNAPSPSAPTTPVTPPTESEVVLPGGQEAIMVTVKGDPNTYVIADPSIVPSGSSFSSEEVKDGATYTASAAAVEKYVGSGLEMAVYEMDLTGANGVAITQLDGYINVTLLIPSNITLDEGKTLVVYRLENGRLVRCDTAVDGDYLTFATNHFSTYIIVEQDASAGPALIKGSANSPKTGDFGMAMLAMSAIAAMGAAVASKKKNEI